MSNSKTVFRLSKIVALGASVFALSAQAQDIKIGYTADQSASGERVVCDGNCVTARGAGVSVDFALELLGRVAGEEVRRAVARAMVVE